MYHLDEKEYVEIAHRALAQRPNIENAVDGLWKRGFDTLFLVGIGGSITYHWQIEALLKAAPIACVVENAAELATQGNARLTDKSVAVFISVSGDTPELVAAAKVAREKGAVVLGFIEKENTPLAELSDYLICTKGGSYYKLYVMAFRLLYHCGKFPRYEEFMRQLALLPGLIMQDLKPQEERAREYAITHRDAPLTYVIGSGNLWGWAYCFAMCVLEEKLWVRTKFIHAAEFFHGTLEVIERESNIILIKGEDATRPLMERVERFVHTICENVTVIDTKECPLAGISEEFRGLMAPMVSEAQCERLSVYLEDTRKHPMEIRRYYRRLNY